VTTERSSAGWYYRRDGQRVGPVSAHELEELLAAGLLRPRQPVWQQGLHGLRFVHAATAARGARDADDAGQASGLVLA
jgi:hypothetical protein